MAGFAGKDDFAGDDHDWLVDVVTVAASATAAVAVSAMFGFEAVGLENSM